MPAWSFLPDPVRAKDVVDEKTSWNSNTRTTTRTKVTWPWDGAGAVQFLLTDGTSVIKADWEDITHEAGCGCCAGSRDEVIVAWRDLSFLYVNLPEVSK
jgi:hypothetical protein